jgi:hypothetical protein
MIEPPYDETFEEFERRTGLDNYPMKLVVDY